MTARRLGCGSGTHWCSYCVCHKDDLESWYCKKCAASLCIPASTSPVREETDQPSGDIADG